MEGSRREWRMEGQGRKYEAWDGVEWEERERSMGFTPWKI
jgi:hypothetical protein